MDAKEHALELARKRRDELKEAGELERKNPVEKARENPLSLRMAINGKCYDCVCGERYVKRIRYCNIFDCTLWPVRPYSKGVSKEDCLSYSEQS